MPLTGTVDAANARIDLFVDFVAEAGTQTSATLARRVGDINAPGQYVRGLFGTTLLGEQAYVSDHEAPLDKQIWYTVTAQDGTTMTAGPFTIPGNGYVWMKDPGRPWADLRLDLCENPDDGRDPCPTGGILVSDTFSRTSVASWGNADTGQTWTNTASAADFSVSGGFGRHTHPVVNTAHTSVVPATVADQEIVVSVGVDQTAAGDSLFAGPVLRHANTSNYYWARLTFLTTGSLQIALRKRVAGTETGVGPVVTLPFGYVPNQMFRIRFLVVGDVIRIRVWPASVAEGTEWNINVHDTSLMAAGNVGVRSLVGSASTNVNTVFLFDDFTMTEGAPLIPAPGDDIAWVGFQNKTREMDAGLFPVLDKQRATAVFARRKDLTTGCLFLSRTREAIDSVYDLYTAGGPLLFQIPSIYHMDNPYGLTDRYYQPGDLVESYISEDQRRPPRLWSVPLQTTELPVGEPQGTDAANFCALNDAYETFADLTAAGLTWGQIAQGDF